MTPFVHPHDRFCNQSLYWGNAGGAEWDPDGTERDLLASERSASTSG
jgi:hypothetical protein